MVSSTSEAEAGLPSRLSMLIRNRDCRIEDGAGSWFSLCAFLGWFSHELILYAVRDADGARVRLFRAWRVEPRFASAGQLLEGGWPFERMYFGLD